MIVKTCDFFGQQWQFIVCDGCEQKAVADVSDWILEKEGKAPVRHWCRKCQERRATNYAE